MGAGDKLDALVKVLDAVGTAARNSRQDVGDLLGIEPRPGGVTGSGVPGPRQITARDQTTLPGGGTVIPPGYVYYNGVLIPGPPRPPYDANTAERTTGAGAGATAGAGVPTGGASGAPATGGAGDSKLPLAGGGGIPSLVNATLTVRGSTGVIETVGWLNQHCKRSVRKIQQAPLAGTHPIPIWLDEITWDCGQQGQFQMIQPRQSWEDYYDQSSAAERGTGGGGGGPTQGTTPKIQTPASPGSNIPPNPGSVFSNSSTTISADGRMLGDKLDRVAGALDKINRGDGGLGLRQAAI